MKQQEIKERLDIAAKHGFKACTMIAPITIDKQGVQYNVLPLYSTPSVLQYSLAWQNVDSCMYDYTGGIIIIRLSEEDLRERYLKKGSYSYEVWYKITNCHTDEVFEDVIRYEDFTEEKLHETLSIALREDEGDVPQIDFFKMFLLK